MSRIVQVKVWPLNIFELKTLQKNHLDRLKQKRNWSDKCIRRSYVGSCPQEQLSVTGRIEEERQ